LIPVARELPTRVGPVDLLYINAQGFLTLVETKLWRNPEARRLVVAQIIDYSKEMARWSYRDLGEVVRRCVSDIKGDALCELVRKAGSEWDESSFIDSVSKNLRLGRFLLLVVGDGIREDVEHMAEFLQRTPQLAFTLGLVELGVYSATVGEKDMLLVQPRILVRTQEIVRAIIELKVPVSPEDIVVKIPTKEERKDRQKITEDEFFEELAKLVDPDAVNFSRWILENAEDHGLQVKWGEAGPLLQWVDETTGRFFTFGQLCRDGYLGSTDRFFERCHTLGLPEQIANEYAAEMARLIPGAYIKRAKHWRLIAIKNSDGTKDTVPLARLWPIREEWSAIIDRTILQIQKHLDLSA
jgi:hypothetical protein